MRLFDYLLGHQDEASMFSQTMVGLHGSEPPAVAAAYDFSGFHTIVDIGGATENMLAAILDQHRGLRGVLFDLAHVVQDAPPLLNAASISERVDVQAGDFFESVPMGGDAYILSHILHDWREDECLKILGNCHAVMRPGDRLLIIEMVLPEDDEMHAGKMLDMTMIAVTGGQERTGKEYQSLLDKAEFRVTEIVPTASVVSVVEAIRKG